MIKFNKYNVVNTETKAKARVLYSLNVHIDGRECVTLYAKDYSGALGAIFAEYTNETDLMTDYFDKGNVDFFEDHPLYAEARKRAEANDAALRAKAA